METQVQYNPDNVTPETFEDAAVNGINYLDLAYSGWRERFDANAFKITSGIFCALAQASMRPFSDTDEFDNWTHGQLVTHGFMTPCQENPGAAMDLWGALGTAWRTKLTEFGIAEF